MLCSRRLFPVLVLSVSMILVTASLAIEQGQVDDFENGSTMGWDHGFQSPTPPTNVADGGPDGAGDNYMSVTSDGSPNGPGGKFVVFNRTQWTGDYLAGGVNAISVQMANFGNAPLPLRIALSSGTGDQWGSAQAYMLPDDGQWHEHTFRLTPSAMAEIFAIGTLEDALSNVNQLRILVAAAGPNWRGDAVVASVGFDDILATSTIIPTETSTWGSVKTGFDE